MSSPRPSTRRSRTTASSASRPRTGGRRRRATPRTGAVAGDRRQRIAIELYHVHLPRLDDAGLVSFDPASKLVEDWRSNMLLDAV
ncbi:DUF7344 domain-containing protein [Natronomonas salina]|uniref:DUF7344 domain-containing protein n=1 Tax=Natronomonas salina TaxID=1710540 RepID=UPI003CCCF031